MAVTISQVESTNPGELESAASRVGQSVSQVEAATNSAKQTSTSLGQTWQGTASDAATDSADETALKQQRFSSSLKELQSVLSQGGAQLAESRSSIVNTTEQLRGQGWAVADDGTVSVQPGGALAKLAATNPVAKMQLQELAASHTVQLKTLLAQFETQDQELAAKIRSSMQDLDPSDKSGDTGNKKDDGNNKDDGTTPDPHDTEKTGSKLTAEQQEEVAKWSQYGVENGGGDCSRWAIASALANKYGVRDGADGKEIALPSDVQNNLMGGKPLHFPPTKSDINQITTKQGVTPTVGGENDGFPGGPQLMSEQLNNVGLKSEYHTASQTGGVPGLVDKLTDDVKSGNVAVVNGSVTPGGGHFVSITGVTTGPNGETMYLVNDSNRVSDGSLNSGTLPYPCTRAQLTTFLNNRVSAGDPGYSTIDAD